MKSPTKSSYNFYNGKTPLPEKEIKTRLSVIDLFSSVNTAEKHARYITDIA